MAIAYTVYDVLEVSISRYYVNLGYCDKRYRVYLFVYFIRIIMFINLFILAGLLY